MQMKVQHENPGSHALDSILPAKYPWLLEWALRFSENDRSAAEDLVQECLVRVLSMRPALSDLDHIEPLLYAHLRYAFLTERRRAFSESSRSLDIIDFDTFLAGLRVSAPPDEIDAQNDLLRILNFLLWRRRTAKFASIFLLRFFYGFTPQEIAGICLASRRSVDLGLLHARKELKTYRVDSSQLHILRRHAPPEFVPSRTSLPFDDFVAQLLQQISKDTTGACIEHAELERRYRALNPAPFNTVQLAHIVSCEQCLGKLTRLGNIPPPSTRSIEDSLKQTRRASRTGRSGSSDEETVARILSRAEQRAAGVSHHRPKGLIIAVNSEIVAERDISSSWSMLKIETRAMQPLEMIEVFSEHNVLLLALAVLERPPQAPPEVKQDVTLSDDRTLQLTVRFTAGGGAVIETTYCDPHFVTEDEMEWVEENEGSFEGATSVEDRATEKRGLPIFADRLRTARERMLRCLRSLRGVISPRALWITCLTPITASVVFLAIFIWMSMIHEKNQGQVNGLLQHAAHVENSLRIAQGPGVVHQRVRIHAETRAFVHDLYRDLEGRRRAKPQSSDEDERTLRARLVEAGLDWDDPLSASDFQAWRIRLAGRNDDLVKADGGSMTVTTTATVGPIERESLTMRLSDFHPIARTMVLRDHETIEIAELSYEILPWNTKTENWFEPLSSSLPPSSPLSSAPKSFSLPSAPLPSESELDIVYLNVLLELRELRTETERIEVERTPGGVSVNGVVETEDRKQEIADRLRMLPHVSASIWTSREAEAKAGTASAITSVQAISQVADQSPIDAYCAEHQVPRDRCQHAALLLMNSSAVLVRESSRLHDLLRQYPAAKPLTPAARLLLEELVRQYQQHLLAAVQEQETVFPMLGVPIEPMPSSSADHAAGLEQVMQHNLLLAKELVYERNEHSRNGLAILQEMVSSAQEARATASQIAASVPEHSESLSDNRPTTHHD
jgi:DNA-directed RNA polymerase specialized sigma24 family protein